MLTGCALNNFKNIYIVVFLFIREFNYILSNILITTWWTFVSLSLGGWKNATKAPRRQVTLSKRVVISTAQEVNVNSLVNRPNID